MNILEPLFQRKKSSVYEVVSKWPQQCDKEKFSKARNEARRTVRKAKNKWFMEKADEAQKVRFGGKAVWKCIRDMQYARQGLVSSRLSTVNDEEGNPCMMPEIQQEQWRRHFSNVLNVQSQFSDEELNKVRQRPVRQDLAELLQWMS